MVSSYELLGTSKKRKYIQVTIANVLLREDPNREICDEFPHIQLLTIPNDIVEPHATLSSSNNQVPANASPNRPSRLLALPAELSLKIVSYLPLLPRLALALTCKRFAGALTRDVLLTTHAASSSPALTIFSLYSYRPDALVRIPSLDPFRSSWDYRFFPELRAYEPDWEMIASDPYHHLDPPPAPNGNLDLSLITPLVKAGTEADYVPINPFMVHGKPYRAQCRHPRYDQKDLALCSSRLKHVRNALAGYQETTTYVTKGMVEAVCWEMLAMAVFEWDVRAAEEMSSPTKWREMWFEREKRRLWLWFGRDVERMALRVQLKGQDGLPD